MMHKQSNVRCPCKISCIQFIAMGGIEKGWVFLLAIFFFHAITESMWKTSWFMHLVRLKTNTGRTGCLQAACTWQLPGREGDTGEMSWNDLSPHSIYRIYFTRLNPSSITLAVATQTETEKETEKDITILHKEQAANLHLLTKQLSPHQSSFNRKSPKEEILTPNLCIFILWQKTLFGAIN